MYTRRSRVPFARQAGASVAVALLLAACHPPVSGSSRPDPAPTSSRGSVQVGYGSQDKRDVTAAVNSASGDKLRSNSPRTVADMLVGRFPGVEVRQLSNGTASIRIRGSRSFSSPEEPLIVVDGIPQVNGGQMLIDLSPRDVESIDVLKDAAATSVFGSRGANGVILISTRKAM
jgi:TonB-dependent starch-binding outer membrane protein SusC